jgi:hypothetical protein
MNQAIKKTLLFFIKIYQLIFSPDQGFFRTGRPACRFFPSCSEYSFEAIEKFGVKNGLKLSIRRILKCHPWHPGGFDPSPIKENGFCPQTKKDGQIRIAKRDRNLMPEIILKKIPS